MSGKIVFIAAALLLSIHIHPRACLAQGNQWVTAYYAGWSQGWTNNGVLPAGAIDFSAVTHIIHFSLVPRTDGSLDSLSNSITVANSSELIRLAHAAGKKVLICVGGWGTDVSFRGATSIVNLTAFATNLVQFMTNRGYDGIDIDWEVLQQSDSLLYVAFIQLVRTLLNTKSPRPLLTGAIAWSPWLIRAVQNYLDQINIMTYDLSGAWSGWITWHNAPILSGGVTFPQSGRPVPSADRMVDDFSSAGIAKEKLGIGIDFYGYVWSGGAGTSTGGATRPGQTWTSPPQVRSNVPYYTIYSQYFAPQNYRWDSVAQASYLSIDSAADAADKFISYDDENACRYKVAYARQKGIGGVFIWELGGGYLPGNFADRDRLLQAVKQAASPGEVTLYAPPLVSPENGVILASGDTTFRWQSVSGAATYRFQLSVDPRFLSPPVTDSTLRDTACDVRSLGDGITYYWRVCALAGNNGSLFSAPWSVTVHANDSLAQPVVLLPGSVALRQNYPNPFNAACIIEFELPDGGPAEIAVYNVIGEKIASLGGGSYSPGTHAVRFAPKNLASGVYFYRLTTGAGVRMRKMIVVN